MRLRSVQPWLANAGEILSLCLIRENWPEYHRRPAFWNVVLAGGSLVVYDDGLETAHARRFMNFVCQNNYLQHFCHFDCFTQQMVTERCHCREPLAIVDIKWPPANTTVIPSG